jgi:hypothetical protein
MSAQTAFEVRYADGSVEPADSLWGARHLIARRVAFDSNPVDPRSVLPAQIFEKGRHLFGGRAVVEKIESTDELTSISGSE